MTVNDLKKKKKIYLKKKKSSKKPSKPEFERQNPGNRNLPPGTRFTPPKPEKKPDSGCRLALSWPFLGDNSSSLSAVVYRGQTDSKVVPRDGTYFFLKKPELY